MNFDQSRHAHRSSLAQNCIEEEISHFLLCKNCKMISLTTFSRSSRLAARKIVQLGKLNDNNIRSSASSINVQTNFSTFSTSSGSSFSSFSIPNKFFSSSSNVRLGQLSQYERCINNFSTYSYQVRHNSKQMGT